MKSVLHASILALWVTSATAQEPPPPEFGELAQLKERFAARALSSSKTLSDQFVKALSALAREAGERGDYDLALQAQRRRDALAELYSRILLDPSLSNTIVLRPADAKISGSVGFDRAQGILDSWKAAGGTATWSVMRLVPGTYDVTIEYSVADRGELPDRITGTFRMATGGDLEFFEDTSLSGSVSNRHPFTVEDTGGWNEYTTMKLPPVVLTRNSARFTVKSIRPRGDGGIMQLKEIRLTPARPESANQGVDEDGRPLPLPDPLVALQKTHQEHLRQKLMPVIRGYTERLRALSLALAANTDAVTELEAETRRVERQGDNPAALLEVRGRNKAPSNLPDGFREIVGARYVPATENSGDAFMVTDGDTTFLVRLLYVGCAPVQAGDAAYLTSFANYFGIPVEEVPSVGEQARDFTAAFLKDRPLRLLTRGVKDADGALLVTVQPEAFGDLAGGLVDNGLAFIQMGASRTRASRRHEDATIASLKERETTARTRVMPPGAWSLSAEPKPTPDHAAPITGS